MPVIALPDICGSLSTVWTEALTQAAAPGVTGVRPLRVSITDFGNDGLPVEDVCVRNAIDAELARLGCNLTVSSTANTIFPNTMWRPGVDRDAMFDRYHRLLPRLKKRDRRNQHGTYFERLTSYGKPPANVNQLKRVIDSFQSGVHRKTALQATLFDPSRDHTRQRRRGFPCLQHVTFCPTLGGGLITTGFYAFQYLFVRGYGNYLGLCRLARFMANEMGLCVERVDCYAAVAELGKPKGDVRPLTQSLWAQE